MRYQSIKNRRAFQWIYSKGSFVKGKWVSLRFCEVTKEQEAFLKPGVSVAIAVSKKVAAKATVRNRWKRRIREIIRKSPANFVSGKALIFQVRINREKPEFRELKSEVEELLSKINVKKNNL